MLRNLLLAVAFLLGATAISFAQVTCDGLLTVQIEGSSSGDELTVSGSFIQPQCNVGSGDLTGSISVDITGGTPDNSSGTPVYDTNWTLDGNPFSTDEDLTGLGGGIYLLTVEDENGCMGTYQATLIEPDPVQVSGEVTNLECNSASGPPDGAIVLTLGGGTGAYSFDWTTSTGGIGLDVDAQDQSGLTAGMYEVVVTDINGCTASASFELTEPDAILALATATDPLCHADSGDANGTITIEQVTGGDGNYFYNWEESDGGSGIVNGQANQTGLSAGTYSLTITDGLGCTLEATYPLDQPEVVDAAGTFTEPGCASGTGADTGTITMTPTGGSESYTYSWEATNGGSGLTPGQANQTGLSGGTYTVTVSDTYGCTDIAEFILTEPIAVAADGTFTEPGCASGTGPDTGTITMTPTGGTGAYTYNWEASNSGTGLTAGAANQTGLSGGTYTVTVSDVNGCSDIAVFNLTEPEAVAADGTFTEPGCAAASGDASGTITMTPQGGTGAYTYDWDESNGGSGITAGSATQTGLSGGTYTVTVSDINGCSDIAVFNLTEPEAVAADGTFTEPGCAAVSGDASGTITMTPQGGTGTYTYNWTETNGGSGITAGAATQTGLSGGTYTVTVSDINGCTDTAVFDLTEPASVECSLDSPVLGVSGTNVSCFGDLTTITVDAQGGTEIFTYSLSGTDHNGDAVTIGSQSGTTFTDIPAGTYTVTTVDSNGCSTTCDITITQPDPLDAGTCTVDDACQVGSGEIQVEVAGGYGPYTITWTSSTGGSLDQTSQEVPVGGGSVTFTGAEGNQTYTFSIEDENGCIIGG